MTILLGSLQLTLSLTRVSPDAVRSEREQAWSAVEAEVQRVRMQRDTMATTYGFRG